MPLPKGFKHSFETCEKIRSSRIGKHHTEDVKKKISDSNKGKVFSNETRLKMSNWQKGRKLSESTKIKIGLSGRNKVFSENTKRKISIAKTGVKNNLSEQGRKNISIAVKNRMTGRIVSEETRKRIGLANKGEKCNFWRGGRITERQKIYNSSEYKLWRKSVFERDNYTCVWCGIKNGDGKSIYLEADHIKPFCDYPELRFAIDNGRTLCHECHKKTNTYGRKIFSEKYYKRNIE